MILNLPAPVASHTFRFIRNMHLLRDKAYVNGAWITGSANKTFAVRNPANDKVIANIPDMNVADAEMTIDAAYNAFQTWKETTAKVRSNLLRKWYDLLTLNAENLAKIITLESGKPLQEAMAEVNYGNGFIEWYSEEARRIRGEIIPAPNHNRKLMVERQPIGVAALITPWNFPLAMITRKAGAALAAGCTCIVKPSEDTPLTALVLAHFAEEAGFPKGVFNVLTCDRSEAPGVGTILCTSKKVAGISFTGSTAVGKILYKHCASGVKRCGLELGGNAPFIVFPSANLDKVIPSAIASKFRNNGQACVASNRFLIHEDIYDSFIKRFKEEIEKMKIGNGDEPGVSLGPLINQSQFNIVSDLVTDAVNKGAEVITGGKPLNNLGKLFFAPTILSNLNSSMNVYNDEVFGPVAPIIKFKTEQEAMKIANETTGGLASYIFSEDPSQIFRTTKQIEAGMVGVNEGVISTPEVPFGGIKESGIGREGSHHGIEEYTYYKYICIGNLQNSI